jgi:cyclase
MSPKTNLKKRIIPSILVENYQAIKSKQFANYRIVGNLTQVVELFYRRKVDELVILDIESSKKKISLDSRILSLMTLGSLVPITYGGGIKNLTDIENCLNAGCEKVILNSILYENPKFLSEAVKNFGSQAIIVNIDIKKKENNYKIFNQSKNVIEEIKILDHLKFCQESGCGEIVLNSVDNDGMMCGYDPFILKKFRHFINRPLIINGGCGSPQHMKEMFLLGADACMGSSIFYFTRYSYSEIKEFLLKENINIRF